MNKKDHVHSATHKTEEILNEAGEESFPASDPIAWTLGAADKLISEDQQADYYLVQILSDEVIMIKKILPVITILTQQIKNRQTLDATVVNRLQDFFKSYLEVFHQQKQEILFPLLAKGEGSLSQYLIHDLQHEHQYGKELLIQLKNEFKQYMEKAVAEHNQLITILKDLYDFYVNHIVKENEYLLPAIHALIDKKTQAELGLKFNQIKNKATDENIELLLEFTK